MSENIKPKQSRKGTTNNPNGRPKGIPNKKTQEFRETITKVLDSNSENIGRWLAEVANGVGDTKADPAKALDLIAKLAEYAAPKLSRAEVTGEGGGPVDMNWSIQLVPSKDGR